MSIVTILVTRQGIVPGANLTTEEQNAALYKGVSELLHQVMDKHPDDPFVIFREVDLKDWARCGVPVHEWFARTKLLAERVGLSSSAFRLPL